MPHLYSSQKGEASWLIASGILRELIPSWPAKCENYLRKGMWTLLCSMTMKAGIGLFVETNMICTTMMRTTKRCIRHVLSHSLFPTETALTKHSDTDGTITRQTIYRPPDHGPYSNTLNINDITSFSLNYTYNKQTNWINYLQHMDYHLDYGLEMDFKICRNMNTVSSFFAALRLEDIYNHQVMWEDAHNEIAKEKFAQ